MSRLKTKIIPPNDAESVKAMRHYKILDAPSEETFRKMAEMVARIFDMAVGFVAFVNDDRAFYKDCYGNKITGQSIPRDKIVCSLVVLREEPTIIKDITKNPCMLMDVETASKAGFSVLCRRPYKNPKRLLDWRYRCS